MMTKKCCKQNIFLRMWIWFTIGLNLVANIQTKFVEKGDTSFIIHFCLGKEWMCSGAYIDKLWILTTVPCSLMLQMDFRIEAVASDGTFSCNNYEKRMVRSSFIYTLKYFSLDTDIGLVQIDETFKRKLGVSQIELDVYQLTSKTCSLYGLRKISTQMNYDVQPLKGFQSRVLFNEECLKYYDIEPKYFVCLSKIPGAEVWNFPVVCEGALEGFVVADDDDLLIALRLVVFYDWIRNHTNPTSFRSASSSMAVHCVRQHLAMMLPLSIVVFSSVLCKLENIE